tara:strand:- start:12488 stop:13321 length:834 start_codon:yes stop_codon:yes gene_type:complete
MPEPLEQHRPRLFALAYRMLGSGSDAEDVLQEAWIRYARTENIESPAAWLTTCVTRLCIDSLRSAKTRREEYIGPWLPEPCTHADVVDVQSLSLAFMHLLERLSPQERAVYLLHEVFDYAHAEVAEVTQMSPEASRKALSRARTRVDGQVRFAPSKDAHAQMLMRFVSAVRGGDLAALESLLAEDAQAVTDAGGHASAALRVVLSRAKVARFFKGLAKKTGALPLSIAPVVANGWPALVLTLGGQQQLVGIETDGEVIQSVFVIMNPEKLAAFSGDA